MSSRKLSFIDTFRGEARKAFVSPLLAYCILGGLLMAVLSVVSTVQTNKELVEQGLPVAKATTESVKYWFMLLLGSGLFGVMFVTREYSNGAMSRSVLLGGSRGRLFTAKTLATALAGAGAALVGLVAIALTTTVIMPVSGIRAEWSSEATQTSAGVFAAVFVTTLFGAAVGWLVRHQGIGIAVFLVMALVVDEGLFRLVPRVGKFMLQPALSSLYRDGRADLLSVPWASFMTALWVIVPTLLGMVVFMRSDIK